VELWRSRINGPIDDLLFPIQHGILYYPGIEVLPPFAQYGTDRMTDESYPGRRQGLGTAPAHPALDRADRVPAAEFG
jgi:putative NADPH-quinone reductase